MLDRFRPDVHHFPTHERLDLFVVVPRNEPEPVHGVRSVIDPKLRK
jgi:hypothetical protein